MQLFDANEEKTKREYILKCEVCVRDVTYDDEQSTGNLGQVTEKMVFLKPEAGSERDRFYDAWLPSGEFIRPDGSKIGVAGYEVAIQCGHPINGYFRGAVRVRDRFFEDHHIFVMTMSAEKELLNMNGRHIIITVLGKDDEMLADKSKSFDLAGNINK